MLHQAAEILPPGVPGHPEKPSPDGGGEVVILSCIGNCRLYPIFNPAASGAPERSRSVLTLLY